MIVIVVFLRRGGARGAGEGCTVRTERAALSVYNKCVEAALQNNTLLILGFPTNIF